MRVSTQTTHQGRRASYLQVRRLPIALLAGLAFCAAGLTLRASAPEQPSLEYRVKAAFLMNFAKFVEWPPAVFSSDQTPLSLCTLGADVFGTTLEQMVAGETANGRRFVVQKLDRPPAPGSCQVLFVNLPEKDRSRVLAALGPDVLTVGEGVGFLRDGGMIALVIDNRRVRFDINQTAAEHAGLKMSSQLLKVARVVRK